MSKYVLSLLVKPKLKNHLSVLRYRLPRFRGKGQYQRHKSIKIDRLNNKLVSISGPFRSMKCANVAFSVDPRIRTGDAEH